MSLFSQRVGLKPATKAIQRESLDQETRNGLWSVLWRFYQLVEKEEREPFHGVIRPFRKQLLNLASSYWTDFFKKAADTEPEFHEVVDSCKRFVFGKEWSEVLDFLDFTTQQVPEDLALFLREELNRVLSKESSVYRFVGGLITEITTSAEIQSIDTAIETTTDDVSEHLQKALRFLSDRKTPDYHNSIKESVSAIEAAARLSSGDIGATLASALKKLHKAEPFHPALFDMLMSLYGYCGDEGGVRHANKPNAKPVTQAEARLILVLSSAMCSYLAAKR